MSEIAIQLRDVSKFYKLYNSKRDRLREALDLRRRKRHREFYALRGIDLEAKKGEILGIVGRNGAGKSTLLKILSGVIPANSGQVVVKGRVSALLELGAGLNPNLDGIQNIYFGGIMMGFSREQMKEKLEQIVAFADIGDFINQPMRTYSTGMRARLGFALAVNVEPDILIVDEVLAVGDELFKRKCYARMEELFQRNCTIVYVTHNMNTINELCSRALFIDRGEIILQGFPKFVTINYEKFLFGKPTQRENIRKELSALNQQKAEGTIPHFPAGEISKGESTLLDQLEPDEDAHSSFDQPCIHKAVYLAEFQSQSRIINKTAPIELLDVHLLTESGERVNYLFPNEYYSLRFGVRFDENAKNIVLAFVFKTEKGLVLTGARYPTIRKTVKNVLKDAEYTVTLRFFCAFLPGTYYIDCGVIGFEEQRKQVLSAEYDALAFKVQNCKCLNEKIGSWAYVAIQPEIDFRLETEPKC